MKYLLPLFTLLLLAWLQAAAEIYKCTDGSGTVQYGDKPCAGNSSIIVPAAAPAVDAHVAERRQRATSCCGPTMRSTPRMRVNRQRPRRHTESPPAMQQGQGLAGTGKQGKHALSGG